MLYQAVLSMNQHCSRCGDPMAVGVTGFMIVTRLGRVYEGKQVTKGDRSRKYTTYRSLFQTGLMVICCILMSHSNELIAHCIILPMTHNYCHGYTTCGAPMIPGVTGFMIMIMIRLGAVYEGK